MHKVVWALAGALIATITHAAEREVSIDGGQAPLYGTLQIPTGQTDGPAVLILAGSGPTDRDGNSAGGVRPNELKQLADIFETAGITSLRIDKRGVGKSAAALSSESGLTIGTYIDDAKAWAAWLASQSKVTCVVIAGHSEGALLALLAANAAKSCGVISLEGPGRRLGVVLREQLGRALSEPLRTQAATILAELEAGRTVSEVDPALAPLFRPSIQPYQMSSFQIDPAITAHAVRAPMLIVGGTKDAKVTMDDFRALTTARPDATPLVVPDMIHSLKVILPGMAKPDGGLGALPLAPAVAEAVVRFVKQCRPDSGKPR